MDYEMKFRGVGTVKSPVNDVGFTDWSDTISEIRLDEALVPGLRGISEYSHIVVVFYLDRVHFDPATDMVRHPRDRADWPLTGVFATRTQYRPNPIGITTVELLGVADNVLRVKGLDALDRSTVLDIKPYLPDVELAKSAVIPDWLA